MHLFALDEALTLQREGRHAEAVARFRAAQSERPLHPAPWLSLSTSLLALGDVRGAIAAVRKGRLRAPRMKEAHYLAGTAYLAGGFDQAALGCFRAAVRLDPDFAEAWVNLGVAHYRLGEIARAKGAMGEALRAEPGHLAAAANLGAFMRITGESQAATALLEAVVARASEAYAARLNLAVEYLHDEREAEALDLLSGEPPPDPAMRQHWQLQRALALILLKQVDAAREILAALGPVLPELEPLLHWRETLLAMAARDQPRALAYAARMENALQTAGRMLPEHRIMAHYDLARFHLQQRDPEKAFDHWLLGHRELARFQPFSRARFAEFVEASIEVFSAARLAAGPRAEDHDPAPVFIVGMPRSGTTLTEQILAAHHAVFGAGERAALGELFWRLGGGEHGEAVSRIERLDANALAPRAAAYLRELHALAPAASRIIDKMPGNFRYLGLIARLLPGARIIECDRDPRDIGLSIFTFRFFGTHDYAHDLGDLGWYIGQQKRLMAHWRAVLPNPTITVRLQDWVEDFDATLCRLLGFLELDYDPTCENFHALDRPVRTASRLQVREKINRRGLGRWRQFEPQLAPLLAALRDSGALAEVEDRGL